MDNIKRTLARIASLRLLAATAVAEKSDALKHELGFCASNTGKYAEPACSACEAVRAAKRMQLDAALDGLRRQASLDSRKSRDYSADPFRAIRLFRTHKVAHHFKYEETYDILRKQLCAK